MSGGVRAGTVGSDFNYNPARSFGLEGEKSRDVDGTVDRVKDAPTHLAGLLAALKEKCAVEKTDLAIIFRVRARARRVEPATILLHSHASLLTARPTHVP